MLINTELMNFRHGRPILTPIINALTKIENPRLFASKSVVLSAFCALIKPYQNVVEFASHKTCNCKFITPMIIH